MLCPTTKVGIAGSALTSAHQALVIAAMKPYQIKQKIIPLFLCNDNRNIRIIKAGANNLYQTERNSTLYPPKN